MRDSNENCSAGFVDCIHRVQAAASVASTTITRKQLVCSIPMSAAGAGAGANGPPVAWKDCEEMYPKAEDIVLAIQDAGEQQKVVRKGKEEHKTKFQLIEKLGVKVYKNIEKIYKPDGWDKNVTRGKFPLCAEIIHHRRHVDVHEVHQFF